MEQNTLVVPRPVAKVRSFIAIVMHVNPEETKALPDSRFGYRAFVRRLRDADAKHNSSTDQIMDFCENELLEIGMQPKPLSGWNNGRNDAASDTLSALEL
jgi:hypothetical protein